MSTEPSAMTDAIFNKNAAASVCQHKATYVFAKGLAVHRYTWAWERSVCRGRCGKSLV